MPITPLPLVLWSLTQQQWTTIHSAIEVQNTTTRSLTSAPVSAQSVQLLKRGGAKARRLAVHEHATAAIVRSNDDARTYTILHDSDSLERKEKAVVMHSATEKESSAEQTHAPAHAHNDGHSSTHGRPWKLFHAHDEDNRVEIQGAGETAALENTTEHEDGPPGGTDVDLESDAQWFIMIALVSGSLNLLSCGYIMVKTWPRAEQNRESEAHRSAVQQNESLVLVATVRNEKVLAKPLSSALVSATPSPRSEMTATVDHQAKSRPNLVKRTSGHHRRTSTIQMAAHAASRLRDAAQHGPWRWSAASWDPLHDYTSMPLQPRSSSLAGNTSSGRVHGLPRSPLPGSPLAQVPISATYHASTRPLSTHKEHPNDDTTDSRDNNHQHHASRHRFAFYTTTTDLVITALVTGGALYASFHNRLPPGGWCSAIGLATYAFIAMDLALVAYESVLFWAAVSQLPLFLMTGARLHHGNSDGHDKLDPEVAAAAESYYMDTVHRSNARRLGRYHWKLWLACAVVPWVISMLLVPAHGFGWDRYWCFVYNYSAGGKSALAFMVFLHYTVLLIVSLCYIPVLRAARSLPKSNQATVGEYASGSLSDNPLEQQRREHHRSVVERAGISLTHLMLQVMHYTPGTLHVAAQFFDYEDLWIYAIAVFFTQSGAFMHAVVIGWTEWNHDEKAAAQGLGKESAGVAHNDMVDVSLL
ncbi:hypothetical protein THASP1DRAFT_33421 [Thamnocephalis sphaerospora]|uniref:G-protein coupled receptors family 2 profile 2 domain-containing protein n=1 Tax=Thamnocephalis sphaerospora TaxID=78915 RepID=A0A4P9XGK4_9FUNG|nr:hypothetical protein THASP1DRAFT_33421 [Thamnocephalis sphaerospora]|eukprot:RKP04775.1 hypothetical protein THASP1DRAFT_33421 [Thamnocephalis sphaerospora]